ncbi:MAG: replication initiation protein [Candidatus Thiodiazotropha weberae]|nr:replication initiation protein [Candidatus Thiodiazotropha weberae]
MFKGEKGELVYKSNELIEAQYELSAAAQKVAATLISKIDPNGGELPRFNLTVVEYAQMFGIARQSAYEMIDNVTSELKRVLIVLREPGSRSFTKLSLFRECHYTEEEKRVEFEFEERLDKHLRDFAGNFTRYQIRQIKKLKSKYSIRLYELLRKSHPIKTTKNVTFFEVDLPQLKSMIGIGNQKIYKEYANFRWRVLLKAQKELHELTDIDFSFEPIRLGRKVHAVKFIVKHNKNHQEPLPAKPEALQEITLPPELESLKALIIQFIPNITDKTILLLCEVPRVVIMDSLMAYAGKSASETIEKPLAYFMAIVQQKVKEEAEADGKKPDSTLDKLLDRSWDVGFDIDG